MHLHLAKDEVEPRSYLVASPRARGKLQPRSMLLRPKDPAAPSRVGREWSTHPPRNVLSLLDTGFPLENLLTDYDIMLMLLTWGCK